MADTGKPDDGTDDGPSLEMPSFSLRRRKKAPPPQDATPEPAPAEVEPEPEPVPAYEPEPIPEPAPEPEPEPEPIPEPAPTTVIPEQPAHEAPTAVVPTVREPDHRPDTGPTDEDEGVREDEPVHREPRPRRELPLSGLPAAAATGVAVGALAVLLAWLAGVGCEAVRGTSSCGGGPGFLILLLVLVALALAGSWLLDRFGVPESGSTSLLAVGIMAVLVMLFLLGSLDTWWAVLTIPVTAVIGYVTSWWVTNAVVGEEPERDAAEPRDVR